MFKLREVVANHHQSLIRILFIPTPQRGDDVPAIYSTKGPQFQQDNLAAQILNLCAADLLMILTDTEGLYDKDPRVFPDATIVPLIKSITKSVKESARGTSSLVGKGGMRSKVEAAENPFGVKVLPMPPE